MLSDEFTYFLLCDMQEGGDNSPTKIDIIIIIIIFSVVYSLYLMSIHLFLLSTCDENCIG